MAQTRHDALIAGAGPSGLAAAIALLERGLRVGVLEPNKSPEIQRAEMLTPIAEPIISRLGIEDILDRSMALGPALSLWAFEWPAFLGKETSIRRPDLSLDRRDLVAVLRARVIAMGGRIYPSRLRQITGQYSNWRVGVDSEQLRARFVIDATGRPAHLARRLGARLHLGLPLVARTQFVPEQIAPHLVIEATESGWWYSLPMQTGGTMGFLSAPGTALESPVLLAPSVVLPFETWDARSACLCPCFGPGWLATGDAAAAFDPVASQGLFNALSSGFFAGNAAADALAGRKEALDLYAVLISRTAERTHRATAGHYATALEQSVFWQERSTWSRERTWKSLLTGAKVPPDQSYTPTHVP